MKKEAKKRASEKFYRKAWVGWSKCWNYPQQLEYFKAVGDKRVATAWLRDPVFIIRLNHFALRSYKTADEKVCMVWNVCNDHIWHPLKMRGFQGGKITGRDWHTSIKPLLFGLRSIPRLHDSTDGDNRGIEFTLSSLALQHTRKLLCLPDGYRKHPHCRIQLYFRVKNYRLKTLKESNLESNRKISSFKNIWTYICA